MTARRSQRRWVISPAGRHASDSAALVVQVVDGQVLVDAPRGRVALGPPEVERLRRALGDARAAAIWDRGSW